ncbi:MAG: hypothetical protein QM796_19045 [Chthoniobacteraceae bacterium]
MLRSVAPAGRIHCAFQSVAASRPSSKCAGALQPCSWPLSSRKSTRHSTCCRETSGAPVHGTKVDCAEFTQPLSHVFPLVFVSSR